MRSVLFTSGAFEQYVYWQEHDHATLRKLNRLLVECMRTPFEGTGKPEPLKGDLSGAWSRRITLEHRLVYEVTDKTIEVFSCRLHYPK